LVAAGGSGTDTVCLRELGGGYNKNIHVARPVPILHALAKISKSGRVAYESCLTTWPDSCRLQWDFLKCPLDAYSLKVEDLWHCQVVEDVRLKEVSERGAAVPVR